MINTSVSVMTSQMLAKPSAPTSADPAHFLNLVAGSALADVAPVKAPMHSVTQRPAAPISLPVDNIKLANDVPHSTPSIRGLNVPLLSVQETPTDFGPETKLLEATAHKSELTQAELPVSNSNVGEQAIPDTSVEEISNDNTQISARNSRAEGAAPEGPTNQVLQNGISHILASLPGAEVVGNEEQDIEATPIFAETTSRIDIGLPLPLRVTATSNRHVIASQNNTKAISNVPNGKVEAQFLVQLELPTKPALFQFPELPSPMPTASTPSPFVASSVEATQIGSPPVLDLAYDNLWIDQLAKEIVAFASNDGKLRFSLSPPALGDLDVAIQTEGDGVNIQLQPSTENAARIFAAEQPKLVEELRQSGVRLNNSDLLGGHQSQGHREQSQTQKFNRQLAHQTSPNTNVETNTTKRFPEQGNGKFA